METDQRPGARVPTDVLSMSRAGPPGLRCPLTLTCTLVVDLFLTRNRRGLCRFGPLTSADQPFWRHVAFHDDEGPTTVMKNVTHHAPLVDSPRDKVGPHPKLASPGRGRVNPATGAFACGDSLLYAVLAAEIRRWTCCRW